MEKKLAGALEAIKKRGKKKAPKESAEKEPTQKIEEIEKEKAPEGFKISFSSFNLVYSTIFEFSKGACKMNLLQLTFIINQI